MSQPRVSIVTPCYYSADTLARTIESVLGQTYPHIEYIITDGASTDNTAQVVAKYADDPRLTFISEPDNGQTDAINKGWRRATGDVLAWLCADDTYFPHTVQTAIDTLTQNLDVGWVYGHDCYANGDGDPVPFNHTITNWDYDAYLSQALYISQPTVFWRRSVIDRFGPLREDLHYMMDMEFFLRIGRDCPGHLIDDTLATITWTRDTKTFSGGVDRMREMLSVIRQYGGNEVAPTVRVQWADAHLEAAADHLGRLEWDHAAHALGEAFRYPAHIPRGTAKLLIRSLLSETAETRLRQTLLRGRSA
jgi:glycosyltransferase involved in cell wall biosynthesis